MANKTATIAIALSYIGGAGNSVTEPSQSILAPYLAQEPSQLLDVPSGATGGNAYGVAFGTIGSEASAIIVKNGCSVPITIRVNGATGGGEPIGPGGVWMIASPTGASGATGAAPVTSLSCVLGGTQTGGAGSISAWVFGDPG
jgi:hypothetical protein